MYCNHMDFPIAWHFQSGGGVRAQAGFPQIQLSLFRRFSLQTTHVLRVYNVLSIHVWSEVTPAKKMSALTPHYMHMLLLLDKFFIVSEKGNFHLLKESKPLPQSQNETTFTHQIHPYFGISIKILNTTKLNLLTKLQHKHAIYVFFTEWKKNMALILALVLTVRLGRPHPLPSLFRTKIKRGQQLGYNK